MIIRPEEKKDYLKVENLVRNAFWNVYRPGAYEHYIVHKLRDDECFISDLAYVIEEDEKIIGHINYSYGKLDDMDAAVLGPVCIDINHQSKGYATGLIEYTLDLAKGKNLDYVFVIGDENFYSRFGFESASKYNIYLEGTDTGEENPFFMIKIFAGEKINFDRAIFKNPDVFDVSESDVDEFDMQFDYKEKKVLEGQL